MINNQIARIKQTADFIKNRYDLTRLIWEADSPGHAVAYWLINVTFILITLSGSSAMLFIGLLKLT